MPCRIQTLRLLLSVAAIAVPMTLLKGCQAPELDTPQIEQANPSLILSGETRSITFTGSGFSSSVERNLDCSGQPFAIDDSYEISIRLSGTRDEWIALSDPQWLDFSAIQGTVTQSPDHMLTVGEYDVQIINPSGDTFEFPRVLEVGNSISGTDSEIPDTDSGADSGTSEDSDSESDTESDTPTDSTIDSETNTESDTPTDSASESETDTASDTPTDSTSESETDTASDTPTDSASESETDTASDTPTDSAIDSETNTESDTPTDSASESDIDTDTVYYSDTDDAANTITPPTIDGHINEIMWHMETSANQCILGSCNNNVSFDAIWNDTYLYVAVAVGDGNLHNDSPEVWNNDSVEIYIDGDHNASLTYDLRDRRFIKGANSSALTTLNGSATGVLHATNSPGTGYAVELAIPWSLIGVAPAAGVSIGFDIGNNDDDNGGVRESRSMWAGDATNETSTRGFGALFLAERVVGISDVETMPNSCGALRSINSLSVPYVATITWKNYSDTLYNGTCSAGAADAWFWIVIPSQKSLRITAHSTPGISVILRRHSSTLNCSFYTCNPLSTGTTSMEIPGAASDIWVIVTVSVLNAVSTSITQITLETF